MKICIGSDHRGFELKQVIIEELPEIEWIDVGTHNDKRTDYPLFAEKVCKNILSGKSEFGVLICGSGIGMSIAANRHKKIYAGLCWSESVAKAAKEDDNINILVLPASFVGPEQAVLMIKDWLSSKFKGGHYQQRLELIDR